jgi:hypothetical protein
MGCSYAAYTVIGCMLDRSNLYKKVEVVDTEHSCPGFKTYVDKVGDVPNKCPDCGASIKSTETRCKVENADELLEGWMDNWDTGNLKEPRIVSDGMNDNEWIGLFVSKFDADSGGGTSYLSTINIKEHKKHLQERLEPLGLWDEGSFGIHTILYISC